MVVQHRLRSGPKSHLQPIAQTAGLVALQLCLSLTDKLESSRHCLKRLQPAVSSAEVLLLALPTHPHRSLLLVAHQLDALVAPDSAPPP